MGKLRTWSAGLVSSLLVGRSASLQVCIIPMPDAEDICILPIVLSYASGPINGV